MGVREGKQPIDYYFELILQKENEFETRKQAGHYTRFEQELWKKLLQKLKDAGKALELMTAKEAAADGDHIFKTVKADFDEQRIVLEQTEEAVLEALEHAFDFMEQAFADGQEMIVFVTELTLGKEAMLFLAEHTCERYLTYNKELLIGSKKTELLSQIKRDA